MAFTTVDFSTSVVGTTGTTQRIGGGENVRQWTVIAETAAGSSGSFAIQGARSTASTCAAFGVGSSANLGAGSAAVVQFTGPLPAIFARVKTLTSTGTITFRFVGN